MSNDACVYTVAKVCLVCRKTNERQFDANEYEAWKLGAFIQNAFPSLSPIEREFLLTGICSDKCFNSFLGPED